MSFDPRTLHEIERKLLKALSRDKLLRLEAAAGETGLTIDQVRRGVEWLKSKNLVSVSERISKFLALGSEGQRAVAQGLPERRLVNFLSSAGRAVRIADIKDSGLRDQEFSAAISNAKGKGWIRQGKEDDRASLEVAEDITESAEERFLRKLAAGGQIPYDTLSEEEAKAYRSLRSRPDYLVETAVKSVEIQLSGEGLGVAREVESLAQDLSSGRTIIDVAAPAPVIYAGRKHPLQDTVDEVREVLVGLGFEEIDGPYVQSSFWNFDVLFTPQDHPAREMQDTFYVSGQRAGQLAESRKTVMKVAAVHRRGWHYDWKVSDAKRMVLRTHTTPVTIRYLAEKKPSNASVFSVGRVFRNEKLTYKHLAEFYQVEGIMVGSSVTLRDLMGLQTEFYSKIGLKKVKFWPSFFPYTEPSLQSMVYHEGVGRWVELFGMGIFRPEVTVPVGVKNPVLAWGGGLERIAMLKYGLDDVRDLYSNRLGWIRSVPKCQS